ncbi:unnamed protein product [Paramecium octaurelia]|uniref:Uncharacterized protein n=1 Tax=Paramecium octaurelia TaxID=43137 RepID=A0A8S1Y187_PAROT|nr:unnamed protein product [Paramecium octaurelia]
MKIVIAIQFQNSLKNCCLKNLVVEMTLSVDEMLRQPKRFYLKLIVTKTFFLGLNCHFNISQFQKI